MAKVLSFSEFSDTYDEQRENEIPKKPASLSIRWYYLVPVIIAALAINILSTSHTMPFVAMFIDTDEDWIKKVAGLAGALSMEFMLITLMLVAYQSWFRWSAIVLAFVGIMASNVIMGAIAADKNFADKITDPNIRNGIGMVMGAFIAFANLSIGEVLRHLINSRDADYEQRLAQWHVDLSEYDLKKRRAYTNYLKKAGVSDATTALQMSSGYSSDTTVNTTQDSVEDSINNSADSKKSSAEKLAEQMLQDGTTGLPQATLVAMYKKSFKTVVEALRIIKTRQPN